MDLKKEIKLGDLFKGRKAKEEPKAAAAPSVDAGERKSLLKRDLSLSVRRRPKDPDLEMPKAKREPKASRRRGRKESPGAAQVPQIPLMRAFNLMPTEDPRQASTRRPSRAQLILAVVALVLLAALGSLFLVTNARVADKQREYDALREQVAARELPVEAPAPIAGDAALVQERDGRKAALAGALGGRVAWDRVLRDLSLVLPDDVWLTGLTGASAAAPADPAAAPDPNAQATGSSVEIKGYARRHEGVALLLSRIGVIPEVDSATLVSATIVKVAGEELVEFSIKAGVRAGAGGAA